MAVQAADFNVPLEALADRTAWLRDHLHDDAALNFPEFGSTASEDSNGDWTANPPKVTIAARGTNGVPYICGVPDHAGNGAVWRSRDGKRWAGSDAVTAGIPIAGIGGRVLGTGLLVAVDGTSSTARQSADVGETWASAGTLPSSGWERIAWTTASGGGSGRWVAAGSSKVAVSGSLSSWTAGTAAHTGSVRKIVTPPEGLAVDALIILPTSSGTDIAWSASGITWSAVNVNGSPHSFMDACWSAHYGAWFLLAATGRVFRAATPAGPWTQVAHLTPNVSWTSIIAFGRAIIIAGDRGHEVPNVAVSFADIDIPTGTMQDVGAKWRRLSVFAGHTADDTSAIAPQWLAALHFDGRVALFRNRFDGTDSDLEVALSARTMNTIPAT